MFTTTQEFVDAINEQEKTLKHGKEQLLGKGILVPNNPANSGSRKILQSTQTEQVLPLNNAETPFLQTGYENELGKFSSLYKVADCDMMVMNTVPKFTFGGLENHIYSMIVQKLNTKEYDVIERVPYHHITEAFGCIYNNSYLDNIAANPLNIIKEGSVMKKSISFDDCNNRCDGVNLVSALIAMEHTKEDGIVVSESAANKLGSKLVNIIEIQINDNDIPLNIYGDDMIYKIIPDIGEEIRDGMLCALRREDSEHMLYSQAYARLRNTVNSDDKYFAKGKVIDIDIFTNNEELLNTHYYQQLKYYNDEKMRYHQGILDTVDRIKANDPNARISKELSVLHYKSNAIVNKYDNVIKNRQFSNILLRIAVLEDNPLSVADKVTNRYGGKGCISAILPDAMMPILEDGRRVEIIYTPPSVINRANMGVLLEQSINFCSSRILESIRNSMTENSDKYLAADGCMEMYCEYVSMVSESMGKYVYALYTMFNKEEKLDFINRLCADRNIIISIDPISETMSINKLREIYNRFDIKLYDIMVPLKNSRGEYRYVKARRKLVCADQYIWRLKQYSKDKLSAVSLSSTNIKGENSKSNSKKLNKSLYSKTCIRFGNMETGNLLHLTPEIVISNLMINSLSPLARRGFIDLLEGDVFNIDIKLDPKATNRAVEIVNARLKAIGLKLEFTKIKKNNQPLFVDSIELFEDKSGACQLFEEINKLDYKDLFCRINEDSNLFDYLETPLFDTIYEDMDLFKSI